MNTRITALVIVIIVIAVGAFFIFRHPSAPGTSGQTASSTPANTYGMAEYVDSQNGFSFWYPQSLAVTASSSNDTTQFPGGTVVETLQVGSQGGTMVYVVNSPSSMITDEPNQHASPISQTRYSYQSGSWMVSYPEGNPTGSAATTTATPKGSTVGNLPILPSGRRFDTSIIPLSSTLFVIVTDGGGSMFTSQLANTVTPANASVDMNALETALQAEASAYGNQ